MGFDVKKNLSLLNRFNKLKLSWWILIVPIFNNLVYLKIFQSWFLDFTDRVFMAKQYWKKEVFFTGGFLVISFLSMIFLYTLTFLLVFLNDSINSFSIINFSLILIGIFLLFNLLFHPINLIFRPKRVKKSYKKYCKKMNINITDYDFCDDNLITYKLKDSFSGIKNSLFDLTYYSLFNPDIEYGNKIKNADIDTAKHLSENLRAIIKEKGQFASPFPQTKINFDICFQQDFDFLEF